MGKTRRSFWLAGVAVAVMAVALLAVGCGSTEVVEVVKEVVVEREVIKEVPVEVVVVQEREVIKEVPIVKEVPVIVEKEVVKTVEVLGEVVVVEKIVIAKAEPSATNSLGRPYFLTGADQTPKRGGVFRMVGDKAISTLDTQSTAGEFGRWDAFSNEVLNRTMIIDRSGNWRMTPALAISWEVTSPTTVEYELRRGVKFHDGSTFNAEVAKWNLDRIRDNPRAGVMRTAQASVQSVDVVDEFTIRINLKNPDPVILLSEAGIPEYVSKVHFEAVGEKEFGRNPSGTGPLRVVSWAPDLKLVTESWVDYWQEGVDGRPLPYIDGMTYEVILDPKIALVGLETNQLDFMIDGVAGEDIPIVERNSNLDLVATDWTGLQRPMFGFNMRTGPMADVRLRKAAMYAIDRKALAKVVGPNTTPHYYPVFWPGMISYDESRPRYDYQPEKAKALVCEINPSCEVETQLQNINREPSNTIGVVVKAMWDAVGIKTTLSHLDVQAWIATQRADEFDATFWRGGPINPDPAAQAFRFTPGNASNDANIDDPEILDCYDRARAEFDTATRTAIFGKCQEIIFDKVILGVGLLFAENYAFRTTVNGLGVHHLARPYFTEVWLD